MNSPVQLKRWFRKYKKRFSHLDLTPLIKLKGLKEIILVSVTVAGLLFVILAATTPMTDVLLISFVILGTFAVGALYGTGVSKSMSDIFFYIPFRITLSGALVSGYIWLVYDLASDLFYHSLNMTTLAIGGVKILAYMIASPMAFKYSSKIAAVIGLKLFNVRPYYERLNMGSEMSEYFIRPSDEPLLLKFYERNIKGLFVYPEDPLLMPAVRNIKSRLGSNILSITFETLKEMSKKRGYKKYFDLITLLRPEIKDPAYYDEMYPFITIISDDRVKEFDLGAASTEQELRDMVGRIVDEKDFKPRTLFEELEDAPWYDQPVKVILIKNPFLLIPVLALLTIFLYLAFDIPMRVAAIQSAGVIVLIEAGYAGYAFLRSRRPNLEEIVEALDDTEI